MTTLSPNLAVALSAIANAQGQDPTWLNIFTELRLYLEVNKDQLNMANAKNLQLESEVNQLTGELNTVSQSLAMAPARQHYQTHLAWPHKPQSYQRFLQTLECMTVPGVRSLKSGGHVFACGRMKILLLLQGQPVSALCCPQW